MSKRTGGKMREVTINLNDYVRVKLTEAGVQKLREIHEQLETVAPGIGSFKAPDADAEGRSRFQLWVLMSHLGSSLSLGCDQPMATDLIVESSHEH